MTGTLTEVAQVAGVSLATASRAFNQPDRLAAATRERVLRAAAELDYVGAVRQSGQTFAMIVRDVANPVIGLQVAAVQEQAWYSHHRIILCNTAEHVGREREILRSVAPDVGGILLVSPRLASDEIRDAVGSTPLVVINGATGDFCPSVLMAADTGIRQAVEHLVALGHNHIAYAPGPPDSWANLNRQDALTATAATWGIELTVTGSQAATIDGGLAAAASVVASGATAVLAYNDLVAVGIRAGARSLGVECPADLSIIGIDDLKIAAVSEPRLTSIRIDLAPSAVRAFHLLTDAAAGRDVAAHTEYRESQFIARETTAAAPRESRRHG